mmetsp:Transcript_83846/g.166374  ORF Transcript_83846/g.166374 Transcript_83846/m.166374 type:complete len:413 (+) Transcript_83846:71-1309(+)
MSTASAAFGPWHIGSEDVEALWVAVRPAYLIALFIGGWAVNVRTFSCARIDYSTVLGLSKDELVRPHRLGFAAVLLCSCLGVFRALSSGDTPAPLLLFGILLSYPAALLLLFSWLPAPLARQARWREPFARALWRCIWPDGSKEVPFIEVLIADGLTSTSKAFFDLTLSSCVAIKFSADPSSVPFSWFGLEGPQAPPMSSESARLWMDDSLRQCERMPMPFIAWAIPFLIRARQCIVSSRNASDGTARCLHIVNLLKYMSALPMIAFAFLHASTKVRGGTPGDEDTYEEEFEIMWALAAAVNSAFSFMWDLVMDWGLMQPEPVHTGNFGLRPVLLFRGIWGFYHVSIVFNLVGRTLWSLRWSSQASLFMGGFFLSSFQQSAEVARRCLWNILRVEWQCIQKGVHRIDKHFPV